MKEGQTTCRDRSRQAVTSWDEFRKLCGTIPAGRGQSGAGPGVDWLQGLTFRQRRRAAELLQRRLHFIHLSVLNKGLKSGELLEDAACFVPPGYAAQKVLHRPRQETTLLGRQRGWRRQKKQSVFIEIATALPFSAFPAAVSSFRCCPNLLITHSRTGRCSWWTSGSPTPPQLCSRSHRGLHRRSCR